VHPGQQPGKQLQQLSQALEALEAESSGRWSVNVATHRRVQVLCKVNKLTVPVDTA